MCCTLLWWLRHLTWFNVAIGTNGASRNWFTHDSSIIYIFTFHWSCNRHFEIVFSWGTILLVTRNRYTIQSYISVHCMACTLCKQKEARNINTIVQRFEPPMICTILAIHCKYAEALWYISYKFNISSIFCFGLTNIFTYKTLTFKHSSELLSV